MKKHHIIVTGVGRSGTTFLMQLFTQLNMDTGFNDIYDSIDLECNAGMEGFVLNEDEKVPYIIKSPFLCTKLESILQGNSKIVIDHAIIPIRDLHSASQSRIKIGDGKQGGLFGTRDPKKQVSTLGVKLYKLMYTLTKYDIPTTMLLFPRIVTDPKYLFSKLAPLLKDIEYPYFLWAFHRVSSPELVLNYE